MVLHHHAKTPLTTTAGEVAQSVDFGARWTCDPLEDDRPGDEVIVTTSRRLLRLSIAATDAGARIERERLTCDPAAWMIAPRLVFGGRAPIDAVQDVAEFRRSILLHGLGFGLDADPEAIDDLLADDLDVLEPDAPGMDDGDGDGDGDGGWRFGADGGLAPRPRLLSCWVQVEGPQRRLFAFCAMVTADPREFVDRVIRRYGAVAARDADYLAGFDHTTALATSMISDALADTLALAAADPESPLAAGLDVVVEQRFHS